MYTVQRLHNDLDPSVYNLLLSLYLRIASQPKIISDSSGLNCQAAWLRQKRVSKYSSQNKYRLLLITPFSDQVWRLLPPAGRLD